VIKEFFENFTGLDERLLVLETRLKELEIENQTLKKENAALKSENAALRSKVVVLEARLNKNSKNSSMPPSSDGWKKPKPNPKSLRKKSGRSPGAQFTHPGKTLRQIETPDKIETISLNACSHCSCTLENVVASSVEKRQAFEISEPSFHVTEYQAEKKTCPDCGSKSRPQFPEGIDSPVQYAAGVKGLISYLQNYQLLPFARISEFFEDIFGLPISEGTIANTAAVAYENLQEYEGKVEALLVKSPTLHVDESSVKVEEKKQWVHSASTGDLTHYSIHEKRGKVAMEAAGILTDYNGILIHDFWNPYFKFDCTHAMCNAHLLRELAAVCENTKQSWADQMSDFLREANHKNKLGEALKPDELQAYASKYKEILQGGYVEITNDGTETDPLLKSKNLLHRFVLHEDDILRFIHEPGVSFDNNQAERDIRMIKVKQKISGRFRSVSGAKQFVRIRGYVSTVRKHGKLVLGALQNVFEKNPFIPTLQATE
jgi:transposase|tara:strand:+ start:139 stop:1602 length:1464 start_codon:yes stop_codon:yes gene_type:complete